jgi:hypothetical protein
MNFSWALLRLPRIVAIFFSLLATAPTMEARAGVSEDSARLEALPGQYHLGADAVSPAVLRPVSAMQSSVDSMPYLQREPRSETATDRRGAGDRSQYHEDLRFQIALVLGAVYVVFLACWLWATRLRPGRR